MTPCERNCFCRCDGSCRGAAPVPTPDTPMEGIGVSAPKPAARPLFPDGVPDFTAEACAQAQVKIP